eukprot:gb/GFBE01009433.1/.p1 GENE.gb/GFBE01009433.1/~~gb/GFBE01009433.1/.p1  ORF type:complete len:764 (+),score=114.80 gb/GFBE01009433.1/:1-2292(+)
MVCGEQKRSCTEKVLLQCRPSNWCPAALRCAAAFVLQGLGHQERRRLGARPRHQRGHERTPAATTSAYVVSPQAEQKVAGRYELLQDKLANGQPLWQRSGCGESSWIYSGANGRWCVSAHKVSEQSFNCSWAHIASSKAHAGQMPHLVESAWVSYHGEEGWQTNAEVKIQLSIDPPPQVLHVTSPNGKQRKAGTFELLEGQLANGQPMWTKSGNGDEQLLYSGADGRWYVSGKVEPTRKNFNCSLGLIASAEPHGSIWPQLIAEGGWQLKADEGWELDSEVRVAVAREEPPPTLFVTSKNEHQKMAGKFELMEGLVNDQHIWKRVGSGYEVWLYSGTNGKWCVSGHRASEQRFDCSVGFLCSAAPHGGSMPHLLSRGWGVKTDDGCEHDPGIEVRQSSPAPPDMLYLSSPSAQQRMAGAYLLSTHFANGQPVWKRAGSGQEAWIYSGLNGHWYVSSRKAFDKEFNCCTGCVMSVFPHGGAMPHLADSWQFKDDGCWTPHSDIELQATSSSAPSVLHLTCPNQQKKEGVYRLLEGQLVNGQPVWKRAGSGEENWLYSTEEGFWYVSTKVAEKSSLCSSYTLSSVQLHGGVLPHLCSRAGWQFNDHIGWHHDPEIQMQTSPPEGPAVLHVSSLDGGLQITGKYWLVEGELTNSRPFWKRAGSGEDVWVYSGVDGYWYLNTVLDGEISCERDDASDTCDDSDSVASSCSNRGKTPAVLTVTSLQGGQFVTGKYFLVEGKAQTPVWKRVECREDSWLYSRNSSEMTR